MACARFNTLPHAAEADTQTAPSVVKLTLPNQASGLCWGCRSVSLDWCKPLLAWPSTGKAGSELYVTVLSNPFVFEATIQLLFKPGIRG